MFGPIRAIAIDDDLSHLLAITTGLSATGIPCLGYWYDRDSAKLRPDPEAGGFPYLRLVFMDLNLQELGGIPETATLTGVVIDVLQQVISKDGGPYLLIFWTRVGTKVPAVRKMLYERIEDIPCPIAVLELSKAPFLISPSQDKDFQAGLQQFYAELYKRIDDLKRSISQAVGSYPALSTVALWESRASEASARAVNKISACAASDVDNPELLAESISRVLAAIAIAAAGVRSAQESPTRALDGGMVEILMDQLGASVENPEYRASLESAIAADLREGPRFQGETQVFAALNTFFHVDTEVTSATAADRGAVISTKPFNKGDLGFKPINHLAEFLHPTVTFPETQQAEIAELERLLTPSAEFVLVELGADCDHAQDRPRSRRYLLAMELSDEFLRLAKYPNNNKLRSESLQLLGPWLLNGEIKYLLVSCERFWTWQDRKPHPKGAVKYRLRASIVNKLLHHHSLWSSRPGIIEFRR